MEPSLNTPIENTSNATSSPNLASLATGLTENEEMILLLLTAATIPNSEEYFSPQKIGFSAQYCNLPCMVSQSRSEYVADA